MTDKMTAEQALHCLMARLAQFDYESGLIDLSDDLPRIHEPEELEWRDVILRALSAPRVPASITVSQCVSSHYARGWNECREAMLKETKNETDQ